MFSVCLNFSWELAGIRVKGAMGKRRRMYVGSVTIWRQEGDSSSWSGYHPGRQHSHLIRSTYILTERYGIDLSKEVKPQFSFSVAIIPLKLKKRNLRNGVGRMWWTLFHFFLAPSCSFRCPLKCGPGCLGIGNFVSRRWSELDRDIWFKDLDGCYATIGNRD